MWISH
jgi:hypothetical protein